MKLGYYKCLVEVETHHHTFKVGDLVCIHSYDGAHGWFSVPGQDNGSSGFDAEEIKSLKWVPDEEAFAIRNAQTAAIQTEMSRIQRNAEASQVQLGDSQNNLFISMDDDTGSSGETALVKGKSADGMKKELADARLAISDATIHLKGLSGELNQIMKEQQLLAKGKLAMFTKTVRDLTEVILMVNLYLGREEEITPIRHGQPAPAESPICFRQRVLFMDEEAIIDAEDGGIDFQRVSEFDEWLLQGNHLDLVMPEPKGVVAFRVRRKAVDYETSALANQEMNMKNFRTYFLIRNGERLWRICNDVSVKENLFPTATEFDEFFFEKSFGNGDPKPMRPGGSSYIRAMEKADDSRKAYMRVMLLLQGLLDRTQIFDPTPQHSTRINLSDPSSLGEFCIFVRDNEMALGHGRPSFNQWREEVNSKLLPGMRVCGEFGSYWAGRSTNLEDRMSRKNVGYPDNHTLYTVDSLKGNFRIHFETESWRSYGQPRRAGFTLHENDQFYLNFDAVSVEDMEFYLYDRTERENYMEIIPLLKCCIAMKKAEIEVEAPFIDLVHSHLNQNEDVTRDQVEEVVKWWKFKNKTHRAIDADDSKAFRMALEEFELVKKRKEAFKKLGDPIELYKQISDPESVLLFAHKKDREFIVLRKASQFTQLLHEETYHLYVNKGLQLKDTKEWVAADKRFLRWEVIHEAPDWKEWPKHLLAKHYLSDVEIQEGAAAVQAMKKDDGSIPIVTVWVGNGFNAYYYTPSAEQEVSLNNGHPGQFEPKGITFVWERKGKEVTWGYSWRGCSDLKSLARYRFREQGEERWVWDSPAAQSHVYWKDQAAINEFLKETTANEGKRKLYSKMTERCHRVIRQLSDYQEDAFRSKVFAEYTEEGGHPDLFDDHFKTVKKPSLPHFRDYMEYVEDYLDSSWSENNETISLGEAFPKCVNASRMVSFGFKVSWPVEFELNLKAK